jgi:hypothetical protein
MGGMLTLRRAGLLPALALAAACAPQVTPGGARNGGLPGGSPTQGTDDTQEPGDSPGTPQPQPSTCGVQTVPIGGTAVEPNIMLAIDRSGSMADPADASGSTSRWDALKGSLGMVLSQNAGKARWGLSLFPSGGYDDYCDAGQIDVPLALGNEAQVKAKVDAYSTEDVWYLEGGTPTGATMVAIKNAAVLTDTTRPNFLVLMTDGEPNCNSAGSVEPTIAALYAQATSVKTFVIGFGEFGQAANLNAWAVAGHTDRPGTTKYYQANSATELQAAFQAIVSGVASCSYQLQTAPDDPTLVAPFLDGDAVARDATNGFTYDAATQSIVFHGTACDTVRSGTVASIEFRYGCAAPEIL